MKIAFAGTPEVAVSSLRRLCAEPGIEVVGVLSQPDTKKGRGSKSDRQLTPPPVAQFALEKGIECIQPESLTDPDVAAKIVSWQVSAIAVVAYGKIIPEVLLNLPEHGWINLHFSLLPAWRGAAPVQAAIAAGDEVTGASTFRIAAGLDTGPVLGTITEPISATDTAASLLSRLSEHGSALLVHTLRALDDGIARGHEQPSEGVSYAPKVTSESARITWNLPAHIVERRIRAVTPAPGAWSELRGNNVKRNLRVKFSPVILTKESTLGVVPGNIRIEQGKAYVATADVWVELTHIQPEGKKSLIAVDWLRNYPGSVYE